MEIIFSIWTVVVLLIFLGVTCWAWSGKQKDAMAEAALMIFDEDDEPRSENNG